MRGGFRVLGLEGGVCGGDCGLLSIAIGVQCKLHGFALMVVHFYRVHVTTMLCFETPNDLQFPNNLLLR